MPIYEYVCSGCGLEFELLRPLSQAGAEVPCLNCRNSAERKLSVFACFSRDDNGTSSPVAGTGSSCASCSATSCDTCDM